MSKLTKEQWERILSILLGAVLAVLAVLGWVIDPVVIEVPVEPAQVGGFEQALTGYEGNFGDIYADSAVVGSLTSTGAADLDSTLNADGATTLNSTLDVDGNISSGTGGITLADTVNATGAVDFDSTLNVGGVLYPSFADETITDGETLTATVTVYALDSASAVTMTLAASASEGQLLILIGDDANDITIADTNLRSNDGNAQVLNQYDILILVYQDNEWVELGESSNS